jgi:hypothetical protein
MLAPDDRTLYTECLRAPPGYKFDCCVALTFSLDLEALLVLPLTLVAFGEEDVEGLLKDPIRLLEALREHAERMTVFHQQGQIHVPRRQHILYGLLEDSVVPVRPRDPDGVFHPKLWMLRFVDADGAPLLRAVVPSRNLTFDRSWDVVLSVEGTPRRRTVGASKGLAAMLRGLPQLSQRDVPDHRLADLELLADEAGRTVFEAPEPFRESATFYSLGLDGKRWLPTGDPGRLLVVSPFLSSEALKEVGALDSRGDAVLVSRAEELDQLPPDFLEEQQWDARTLAENADADVETADRDDAQPVPPGSLLSPAHGLHAKIVVLDAGWNSTWWLGSANATNHAWHGRNVELVVELHGRKSQVGIDTFLDDGFGLLLRSYEPRDSSEESADEEHAIQAAQDLQRRLARTKWSLEAAHSNGAAGADADSSEGHWELRLSGEVSLEEGESLSAWPVTMRESTALDGGPLAVGETLVFTVQSIASLTGLIAFSATARHGEATASARFVLGLTCTGLPDDRQAHIVSSIVTSKSGFFRYLRMLLAGIDSGLAAVLKAGRTGEGASADGEHGVFDDVVLEDIVRALSRAPERLAAIQRLMTELMRTEDGRRNVPEEFITLWDSVVEVQPELAAASEKREGTA